MYLLAISYQYLPHNEYMLLNEHMAPHTVLYHVWNICSVMYGAYIVWHMHVCFVFTVCTISFVHGLYCTVYISGYSMFQLVEDLQTVIAQVDDPDRFIQQLPVEKQDFFKNYILPSSTMENKVRISI